MRPLTILLLTLMLVLGAIASCEAGEGYATYYTTASCQSEGTSGVTTAAGWPYREANFTCARPSYEMGSRWRVTNLENGQTVIVVQTDFGPGRVPQSRKVIIDLTPAAFQALGVPLKQGRVRVRVEVVT